MNNDEHINIWTIRYSLIKCLQDRVTRYVFVIYWLLTIPHTSHGSDLHIWENLIRYMGCFWSKSDECQCVEYLPKSLPFYERFKFCFKFKFCLKFKFKFRGGNTMWGKGWRHKATVNLTHSVHSWSELLSFAFILSPKQTWLVSSTCDLHLVCETVPTIKPVHPLRFPRHWSRNSRHSSETEWEEENFDHNNTCNCARLLCWFLFFTHSPADKLTCSNQTSDVLFKVSCPHWLILNKIHKMIEWRWITVKSLVCIMN